MTLTDLLEAAEALTLEEHQQLWVRLGTAYHRRLADYRKARRESECKHDWGPLAHTGRGEETRRCVQCGMESKYHSDD